MARRKVTDDEQFDYNCKHMDLAREHFGRATVVVYIMAGPFVEDQGSGVLFQVADKHFIFSAAHVLDQGSIHNRVLKLGPHVQGGELISLYRLKTVTSKYPDGADLKDPKMRKHDPYDMCVCELSESVVEQLGPNARYVRMPEILQVPHLVPATYVAMGFPSAKSDPRLLKNEIYSEALPYITSLHLGELPNRRDWDIALDYSPQGMMPDRTITPNCDLDGMSGCGLWRLADPAKSLDDWELGDTRLVGIQHAGSMVDEYIRGTHITACLSLVLLGFPELKDALQLVCQG